jgi:hypothetical protein
MSPLAIAGIVGTVYVVVVTFTYALMKMASDADDAIEAMFHEEETHD